MAQSRANLRSDYLASRSTTTLKRQLEAQMHQLRYALTSDIKIWSRSSDNGYTASKLDAVERIMDELSRREK